MRASRGNTSGREPVALRRALVVAQVALSLTLLFGSLLFARSLRNVMTVDPGFRSDGIVVVGMNYRRLELPVERRQLFRRELVDRVRAVPGVQAAATVGVVPLSGNASGNDMWPEHDRSRRIERAAHEYRQRIFRHASDSTARGAGLRRARFDLLRARGDCERSVRGAAAAGPTGARDAGHA